MRSPLSKAIPKLYFQQDTDMKIFPQKAKQYLFNSGSQLSIGDLHGNALKLFFFLIKHGVFSNISLKDYHAFIKLYEKSPKKISKRDLVWFALFLKRIKVNRGGTIRLLGDELADRGANDYFTLKFLEKLIDNNVPVETVLSNHTLEFTKAYETQEDYIPKDAKTLFLQSVLGLDKLVKRNLITKAEVDNLYEKIYFPNLKAITFTVDEEKGAISIFSHAPVGLNAIESICKKLKISYKDSSLYEMASTINALNEAFSKDYVKRKKITSLLDSENDADRSEVNVFKFPFTHITLNRNYSKLKRPNKHNGYSIVYIHGHDRNEPNVADHIYNLDNLLGKNGLTTAAYDVHYTHEKSALEFLSKNQSRFKQPFTKLSKALSFKKPVLSALVIGSIATGFAWYIGAVQFAAIGIAAAISSFGLISTMSWLLSKNKFAKSKQLIGGAIWNVSSCVDERFTNVLRHNFGNLNENATNPSSSNELIFSKRSTAPVVLEDTLQAENKKNHQAMLFSK